MGRMLYCVLAVVIALGATLDSYAITTIVFTEAAFDAAVTSGPITDFEDAPETEVQSFTIDGHNVRRSGTSTNVFVVSAGNPDFAVAPPLPTGRVLSSLDTEDFTVTFASPAEAVGFDAYGHTSDQITLELLFASGISETRTFQFANPSEVNFIGVIGSSPMTAMRWTATDPDENTGIDNLRLGSWVLTPVSPLNNARAGHTATRLRDDRVIVVGGIDAGDEPLAGTELYSPQTTSFSVGTSTTLGRMAHTATLLADGRVLVAGGDGAAAAAAEIYDPATAAWSTTGPMNVGRSNHAAVALLDGRVLIAGGETGTGPLASVELFDPIAGAWQASGSLGTARARHSATVLRDGRVLVIGGDDGAQPIASAEFFDPVSGAWSPVAIALATARTEHTATLLDDGRVFVAGGMAASGVTATTELFDPAIGSFDVGPELSDARGGHTATRLDDGRVMVAAGQGRNARLATTEVFDPGSGLLRASGTLGTGRTGHAAAPTESGVLVAGGTRRNNLGSVAFLSVADVFNDCAGSLAGADLDGDGKPDVCDTDDDGDLVSDVYETDNALDPLDPADALLDLDGDTFSNIVEFQAGTLANDATSIPVVDPSIGLVASVLPASRAVRVGAPASAFATVINTALPGDVARDAVGCDITLSEPFAGEFAFQQTDPFTNVPVGVINSPVTIAAGQSQSFAFVLSSNVAVAATNIGLQYACANSNPAASVNAVNSLLFAASTQPIPDVVALAATPTGDGIVDIPGTTGTGAFAVATVNVGVAGDISAVAVAGPEPVDVALSVCQTDPATALCINPAMPTQDPVSLTISANETPTFSVFVTGQSNVEFSPATARVFLNFSAPGGEPRGSTSVAVRTAAPP